jgi:hypothetical protein
MAPVSGHILQISTLIFASTAAVGSIIRVAQNRRLYRFHKRVYEEKQRKRGESR